MGKKLYGFCFLFWLSFTLAAQVDSADAGSVSQGLRPRYGADRAAADRQQAYIDSVRAVKDSLKAVGDSLSMVWIKAPDPDRPNLFLDSLVRVHTVKGLDFQSWAARFPKKVDRHNEGKPMPEREQWVFFFIVFLVIFFAVLRNAFAKELNSITESFYSNRMLSKISLDGSIFSSWPFLFFYLLFGLTIGMFLYLVGKYLQLEYNFDGFEWFIILSLLIIGLFALKILVLRLVAILFDIGRMVEQYISLLHLAYFNAAIIFLPIVVAFSLSPYNYGEIFCYLALLLVSLIFLFQFLRAASIILSDYQFSKVYLIIYLCALEICPLIILVKALRF
ncbi:MAG TPA: DUF4271 domain-containing protein [Sphingobacteriaceae bacterium]